MMESMWSLGLAEQNEGHGVQATLLFTDGQTIGEMHPSLAFPYPVALSEKLEAAKQNEALPPAQKETLKKEIANWFLQVSRTLIDKTKILPSLVGISGPKLKGTDSSDLELAQSLVSKIQRPVVYDFQQEDRKFGGTSQFLEATYIQSLVRQAMQAGKIQEVKRLAVVEIEDEAVALLLARNGLPEAVVLGPGFRLVDEFTQRTFQTLDEEGKMAGRGDLDSALLKKWFKEIAAREETTPEQALPQEAFLPYVEYCLKNLLPLDGVATLVALTAQMIERRLKGYPGLKTLLLVGRGAKNFFLQSLLSRKFTVILPREIGWNTSFLNAEVQAFLAVRRFYALPTVFQLEEGNATKPVSIGTIYPYER